MLSPRKTIVPPWTGVFRAQPVKRTSSKTAPRPAEMRRISLNHPQLLLAFLRNALGAPRRVPDDVDLRVGHARHTQYFALRVGGDRRTHAATGRGKGHLHFDEIAAAFLRLDFEAVNEAEVDDVDRNFGIVAGFELRPNVVLVERAVRLAGAVPCRLVVDVDLAEGVGIGGEHAE